jgi:hypothetical protein
MNESLNIPHDLIIWISIVVELWQKQTPLPGAEALKNGMK